MRKEICILLLLFFSLVVFSQIEDTCKDRVVEKAPDSMLDKHLLDFISPNKPMYFNTLLNNRDIKSYPRKFIYQLYNLEKVTSGLSIENTSVGAYNVHFINNVYLMNYQDNESLNATLDTISHALLETDGMLGDYELFSYFKRRAIFFVDNKHNRLTIFLYNPFGAEILNKQVDYFMIQNRKNFDRIIDVSGSSWKIIE